MEDGYTCATNMSHFWGQYSPYFNVIQESDQKRTFTPAKCQIIFAQLLARHGARDPTEHKSDLYAETISRIKSQVPRNGFDGKFAFLADYEYKLGADQLTDFGRDQLVNMGNLFFESYPDLAASNAPFIRASGQERVVESAYKFLDGFHQAQARHQVETVSTKQQVDIAKHNVTVIPETPESNNTLNHGRCPAFERSTIGKETQTEFAQTFLPDIRSRLQAALPTTTNLSQQDTLFLMDLCPFETVASPLGTPSEFCSLFSIDEWRSYDYYQTLGKYYGSGSGNPLGPVQGAGFVSELIARLTRSPLRDEDDQTTVNHTLDSDPDSFPLDRSLYADFSHDNLMSSVFAAMRLFDQISTFEKDQIMDEEKLDGFRAATTVPFAGRMVVEKLVCGDGGRSMVRVLMNGRVLPLKACSADAEGLCALDAFVKALRLEHKDEKWETCFEDDTTERQGEDASMPVIVPP